MLTRVFQVLLGLMFAINAIFWCDYVRGFYLFLHARFLASSLWLSVDAKRATPRYLGLASDLNPPLLIIQFSSSL